jgi:GH24 family phage-related lysozyme (muramidase)/CheY-like chemotaxis protein/Tfp pilus assembly protein PilF
MAASLRMSGGSGGGKTHEDPAPLKEAVTAEELRGLVRIKTSDGFFPHAIGSITREKLVAAGWADDGALSDALDELARLEPLLRLEILWVGDHGRSRLANDFRASGALVDHVSDGDQVIALLGERSLANLIICDLDNEDDERVTLDLLERVGDLERAPAVIGYATQFAQGRAQRMKAAGAIACSRSESALEKAVIAFALREPLPLDPDDTAGETAGTVGGKEAKTGGQSMTRAPLAQVLPPRELRRLAALRRARAMPGPETFGAETWAKLTAAGWKIDYYLEEALEDLAEHSPMIGFRILWVDDNPSNNAGSVAAFRNMGAEVVEVLDTDAALARLAEGYPADLVISDMGRAGFDQAGFELLERLKSFTSPPPVIIYAGWFARDATRRRQARTAGAIACLRNNRELIDAVLALAAGHGVPADPEDASAEVSGTGPEDARATHPAASESQESITKSFYHAEHSGIEALQHGDAAGATKAYTAMLAAAERLDDPSLRAAAHLRLGEAARIRNRDDEVEQHYRAALEEALRTPDMSRVAEIYILLGESHEARGDLAAAVETYRKALDYERESPQAFIAFSKLGRATRALGDLEEAGRLWELALEIAQSQEILPDVLQTLRSLAALSEQKRDVERASYFWEQALVASRGDVNETRALLDYAQFAKRFGQYDQARHRFEIGLKRAKSESDDVLVAESAIGLAETAFEAGALDESEDRYREALHTLHKTLDKEWQAEILFRLGLIASRQNRLEEGKSSLAEALALAPHDSGEVIANCHLELGRLDLKRRDTAPARKHLESALHRFEELGDQRMAAYASYDLWRLDTSIGAHRQAREHLVKAHGIMDRLGDPDTAARWRAELEPAPAQPSRPSSSTTALQLITDVCLRLIQQFEGFGKKRPDGSAEAYPDPGTGGDPWTIGWGTTGPDVKKGVVWTQAQCDSRFRSDLERFAKKVLDLVGNAPTTQNQFDALLSFAYNVGPQNLSSSTLLKKHKAGDYRGAATEFTKWNKAAGKTLPGLVRRRAAEAELYSAAGPTTN